MYYELYAGSVIGTDHVSPARPGPRNGQDAFYKGENCAIVSDGCGSAKYAEVAAILLSHGLGRLIDRIAGESDSSLSPDVIIFNTREYVTNFVNDLKDKFDNEWMDYALATLVIAFWKNEDFFIHSWGDGIVSVNGEVSIIESEGNAPRYPAYDDPAPQWQGAWKNIDEFMIATDGFENAFQNTTAGRLKEAFFAMDKETMFATNVKLQRRMNSANWSRFDGTSMQSPGLFSDDATAIFGFVRNAEDSGI